MFSPRYRYLPRIQLAHLVKLFSIIGVSMVLAGSAVGSEEFDQEIRPLLRAHCTKCHGDDEDVNGEVDFTLIKTKADVDASFDLWESAAELIAEGAMPPSTEPALTEEQKELFARWYQVRFVESVEAHPGYFRPRRLSAEEYRNTLHSLFGFDLDVAIMEAEQTLSERSLVMKLLPPDPPGRSGFTNDTSGNPLTTVVWDQYSYIVDNGLEKLFSDEYRAALEFYTGPLDTPFLSERQAKEMLAKWTQRARRRPIDAQFLDRPNLELTGKQGAELEQALRFELKAVLMSPSFVFRGLLHDAPRDRVRPVDQFELAERLSYFLWADMPDATLFDLAAKDQLSEDRQFAAQIDRMLASPKARSLTESFAVQWFSLNEIEKVSNNPPHSAALKQQVLDFVSYLFTEARPLTELIDSDTTFINPHTARFYPKDRKQLARYRKQRGIEIEIVANQRITLHDSPERGGLLTMPGVLAMNKGPVLRGTWLLERILGETLPEPPADVGQVPGNLAGENLTFRQRFEIHRSNESCAVCHDKIDPLGFALQAYDANGKYAPGPNVDTRGQLPSGETFSDFAELKQILITSQKNRVIRTIVERTLAYALCRELKLHDRPTVDAIVKELNEDNATFRDLIHCVANSLPFRKTVVASQR